MAPTVPQIVVVLVNRALSDGSVNWPRVRRCNYPLYLVKVSKLHQYDQRLGFLSKSFEKHYVYEEPLSLDRKLFTCYNQINAHKQNYRLIPVSVLWKLSPKLSVGIMSITTVKRMDVGIK